MKEVVALWRSLNKQIASVLLHIPTEKHTYQFELGDGKFVSLQWLAKDYIAHLEHHIKQIDAQMPLGGKEDEKEHKKEESQVKVDFRAGRTYGDHEYIGASKKACFLLCYPF